MTKKKVVDRHPTTGGDIGSRLVSTLERAYNAIRLQHPEVPEAVIVVQSAGRRWSEKTQLYGHFAYYRWQVGKDSLPELMVTGEGLRRSPEQVLATLIHEAAHGLAYTRQINCVCGEKARCPHFRDTSRDGRYHNKTFAKLAEELGLEVTSTGRASSTHGHNNTELPEGAYAELVAVLEPELRAWREADTPKPSKPTGHRRVTVRCECTEPVRRLQVDQSMLDLGPINCGVCEGEFQ